MAGKSRKLLQFDENGDFRILIISDVQDCRRLDEEKQNHLASLITHTSPHLIVLLGDMLFGPGILTRKQAKSVLDSLLKPVNQSGIPFTFIAGNHDMDACLPLSDQILHYRTSPLCLTPAMEERACPDAYTLPVRDAAGTIISTLLFLDSGATRLTLQGIQYFPATQTQLTFTDALLKSEDHGSVYIFQHIPVPEIYHALKETSANHSDAVKGRGPNRGRHFILNENVHGIMGESPCPAWKNVGQFRAWANSRCVRAAVFGHDHKNMFEAQVQGITFLQTSCAGLSCYGNDETRGGRLLTLHRNDSFDTASIFYNKLIRR